MRQSSPNHFKIKVFVLFLIICSIHFGCTRKNTETPPGDINAFTPIRSFDEVAKYANRNAQIVRIKAEHVLPNGTMDLEAKYEPEVVYEFIGTATEEDRDDKQALPPGIKPKKDNYIKVNIKVKRPRWERFNNSDGSSYSEKNKGMYRQYYSTRSDNNGVIASPRCHFATLFRSIPDLNKYQNDSAVITYDKDGYRMEWNGSKQVHNFKMDCSLVPPKPKKDNIKDLLRTRREEPVDPTLEGVTTRKQGSIRWVDGFKIPDKKAPLEIKWQGRAKRATGTMRRMKSKPCTLSVLKEKGAFTAQIVKCKDNVIYDSRQETGGGSFNRRSTFLELIPIMGNTEIRYLFAFRDTGNRPGRPQAKVTTGGKSTVFGEDPPDFTINFAFPLLSDPSEKSAIFYNNQKTRTPISLPVRIENSNNEKVAQTANECRLSLLPHALDPDRKIYCIAQLSCGKKTIYGQKQSVEKSISDTLKKTGDSFRLTKCEFDQTTNKLVSLDDRYLSFNSPGLSLQADLTKGTGTLQGNGTSISLRFQSEQVAP